MSVAKPEPLVSHLAAGEVRACDEAFCAMQNAVFTEDSAGARAAARRTCEALIDRTKALRDALRSTAS